MLNIWLRFWLFIKNIIITTLIISSDQSKSINTLFVFVDFFKVTLMWNINLIQIESQQTRLCSVHRPLKWILVEMTNVSFTAAFIRQPGIWLCFSRFMLATHEKELSKVKINVLVENNMAKQCVYSVPLIHYFNCRTLK